MLAPRTTDAVLLITSLKPNVARAEAARLFSGPINEMRRGRLQVVMDFYVPFHLFQVRVSNGAKRTAMLLAIDSVKGNLDLYGFENPPSSEQRISIETERVAQVGIDEACAFSILESKVKREAYLKGFFKVKNLDVTGTRVEGLHVPYWVGVYKRQERVSLEVLDAVRGRLEGAKLREVVTEWFLSPAGAAEQASGRRSL